MDSVWYGLKRAYASTLRITRRDFKAIDFTPARMDILHALDRHWRKCRCMIWQSDLRRIIGYSARSTMSELLKELQRLGLVSRRRSLDDERQVEVKLTHAGRCRLWRARKRFPPRWPLHAPDVAVDWCPPDAHEAAAWDAYLGKMERLRGILRNLRFALRDTGTLRYRWIVPG